MRALSLSLCLLGGCRDTARPAAQPSFALAPTDTVLVLERTVCFRSCPTYRLAITFGGRAHLQGTGGANGFVRDLALPASAVAALLGRFASTGFFALDSASLLPDRPLCQVYATDQPGAYLFASDGAKRHAVTHYFGCRGPRGTSSDTLAAPFGLLFVLEGAIDSVAGTAAYVDSLIGPRGG